MKLDTIWVWIFLKITERLFAYFRMINILFMNIFRKINDIVSLRILNVKQMF